MTLTPGHGGIFIVSADGETVWDADVHGTALDLEVIVETIDDHFQKA